MEYRCENDPELPGCKELLAPTPLLTIQGCRYEDRCQKHDEIKKAFMHQNEAGMRNGMSPLAARSWTPNLGLLPHLGGLPKMVMLLPILIRG